MRMIFGVLIWIGIIGAGILYSRSFDQERNDIPSRLAQYLTVPSRTIEFRLVPQQVVKVGDPVFLDSAGLATPIGRIAHVQTPDSPDKRLLWADVVYVELFGSAPPVREGDTVTYHNTPDSIGWVIEMMLPPNTREEIGTLILDAFHDHQDEIVKALRPVVEESIREAAGVIQEDLRASFAKREDKLAEIGDRFQRELVEKELVPLVQDEIWPIIERRSTPLVREIGEEMWDEVSLLRFGWKYLYDASPLPQRNLTEREFTRFVNDKAVPILEDHISEIVGVQQTILRDVSNNPRVQETVRESFRDIAADPEVQDLINEVFREVFIDNERLLNTLRESWNTPQAQRALQLTNARLDPTITKIGETLFGSPYKQITPEFSRVLRNRILHKDDRWMVLHQTGEEGSPVPPFLAVFPGETSTEMPNYTPVEPIGIEPVAAGGDNAR